jgi:beta-lactamase class A
MVRWKVVGVLIIVVAIVVSFSTFLAVRKFIPPSKQVVVQEQDPDQTLLNPTVISKQASHFIINFQPLRSQYDEIQKKYPQQTYIYFSYLNNGAWVGVNERELFTGASTVKVPLAMTLLRSVEQGLIDLSATYSLEQQDLNEDFGDLYKVGAGKNYSLEELMTYMLQDSDNTAANGVMKSLNRVGLSSPLDDVYQAMGWDHNVFGEQPKYDKITVKLLSNMFLALYNATFINPEHSQMILDKLTHTRFNEKIVAGIPDGIVVAHKVGIAPNQETFVDCGIVYAPQRPYIMCLGSNGGDEEKATAFMKEISAVTYQYVINN